MRLICLALLVLGMSTSVFAQGRPEKEICREIQEGCAEIDSPEIVELKLIFNSIAGDLSFWLDLRQDFNDAGETNRRFNAFNDNITTLQIARDAVDDDVVKSLLQTKIDATIKRRDELHSTEPGSKREQAAGAENIISQLNLQLNAVDAAIRDLE